MSMTRRQFLGAAAAGTAAVGAGASALAWGEDHAVQGIDVSQWQFDVDWDLVATANKKFAFHKATEGHPGGAFESNRRPFDPKFTTNWPEMKRIGLICGAYHMVRPSMGNAKAQVDHFLSVAQPSSGDLLPMLDLELDPTVPPADIWRLVQLMVFRIKAKLGRAPFLYTNNNYWRVEMGNPASHLDCPLWVANWLVENPTIPQAWNKWTLWQYTSQGVIPGITQNTVDLDAFNGTLAELNKFRLP